MGTPPGNGPLTILVADDDPEIRELLDVLLADEGYRVLLAAHGAEALDLATSEDVDLIVLDLVMPLFDAADFCRAYRASGGTAPIVLLSARSTDQVEAALEACGAAAYVLKPFDVDAMLNTIAGLLARA